MSATYSGHSLAKAAGSMARSRQHGHLCSLARSRQHGHFCSLLPGVTHVAISSLSRCLHCYFSFPSDSLWVLGSHSHVMGPTTEKLLLLFHTIKLLLVSFNQKWFGKSQHRKKNPKKPKNKKECEVLSGRSQAWKNGINKRLLFCFHRRKWRISLISS